jgi:hypothetical protein
MVEVKPPMKAAIGHKHNDMTPKTRNQMRQLEAVPEAIDFIFYPYMD